MKEKAERRHKGQGSIFPRENGTYQCRITVGGRQISFIVNSRREGEKRLREISKDAAAGAMPGSNERVREAMEEWLKIKQSSLKPTSFDRLEQTYTIHIKDSLVGRSQLSGLGTEDIQRLINDVASRYGFSSVKKVRDLIREFLTYEVGMRKIPFNPSVLVELPHPENVAKPFKNQDVFTTEELERIEALMDERYETTGEPKYRHAALFVLLANTGLRAGEALALQWKDVDLESPIRTVFVHSNATVVRNREDGAVTKQKLIVGSVKTRHGVRTVPLNDTAQKALKWLRTYQEDHGIDTGYIECNDRGDMLAQSTLPKILKRVLEAANVPYRSVHTFRHTAATRMIEAGVDVKVVSSILGHSSVSITYDLYVHPSLEASNEAVCKIAAK